MRTRFATYAVVAATVVTGLTAVSGPPAMAAETLDPTGWICTTDAVPAAPPSTSIAGQLYRSVGTRTSFASDGTYAETRFSRPVAAASTSLRRSGGERTKTYSTPPCTVVGIRDSGTRHGVRYSYSLVTEGVTSSLEIGSRLPAPTDRGRLVVVVESSLWSSLQYAINYWVSMKTADGWQVSVEQVAATDPVTTVRARLKAIYGQAPGRPMTTMLLGRVPVPYSGSAAYRLDRTAVGAIPTDLYYADLDGTWTDTSVNVTVAAHPERNNVPGDGKFDQSGMPSAPENAVGRVDFSNLPHVGTTSTQLLNSSGRINSAYFNVLFGGTRYGTERAQALGIDVVDGGSPYRTQSMLALADPLSPRQNLTAGALATVLPAIDPDRPPIAVFDARSAAPAGADGILDLSSPTEAPRGFVTVASGPDMWDWAATDSYLRAAVVPTYATPPAGAAIYGGLDATGFALGATTGSAALDRSATIVARQRALGLWPELSSLQGDPTQQLRVPGYAAASARVMPGCADAAVSWQLEGYAADSETTISRSIDGGPFQVVATGLGSSSSTTDDGSIVLSGSWVDRGIVQSAARSQAVYRAEIKGLQVTERGSYFDRPIGADAAAISMVCAFTCTSAAQPVPTDRIGASRATQLETTARFSADGMSLSLDIDAPYSGRTVSGFRSDTPATVATDGSCAPGTVGAGYTDRTVVPGRTYTYSLTSSVGGSSSQPNLYRVGTQLPAVHDRGRALVVVESTVASQPAVAASLTRYEDALVADGWQPVRVPVTAAMTPPAVRDLLRAQYQLDPTRTRAAILVGHVPVPYTGSGQYDGHPEHAGAWSSDAYYADLDGTWTDTAVNINYPGYPRNANIPGDGKFDQESLPSAAELTVGRIDFSNLPSVAPTAADEARLTAAYLDRDIAFRSGALPYRKSGFTIENFGFVPAGVLRNVSPVVGSANVTPATSRAAVDASIAADPRPYLLSYTAGGGWYTSSAGVGTITSPVPSLFMGSLGSYYGDWDSTDNFLRGHLVTGLGAVWEEWPVDRLALGGTVGEAVGEQLSLAFGPTDRRILDTLLGDPTLRVHPLAPAPSVTVNATCEYVGVYLPEQGPGVTGFHVYRRSAPGEALQRLTDAPVTMQYVDPLSGDHPQELQYVVRPYGLTTTPRGSFYNLGQGVATQWVSPGYC